LRDDGWLSTSTIGDGGARLLAVSALGPAKRLIEAHNLSGEAARLAAEAVVATVLLSAHIKGDERLTLQIQSSWPGFSFMGEVDASGNVRARFRPEHLPQAPTWTGLLHASKSDARGEIWRGVIAAEKQDIEAALNEYFASSAQSDALLRVGVVLDGEQLRFAGGFLVERLPEHPDYPSLTPREFRETVTPLATGDVADHLTSMAFGNLAGMTVLPLDLRELTWKCRCSQEKVEIMIGSLGEDEITEMIAENGASVTCHFCNHTWRVSEERLRELLQIYAGN
jgi:molecular chaperone Hsp33